MVQGAKLQQARERELTARTELLKLQVSPVLPQTCSELGNSCPYPSHLVPYLTADYMQANLDKLNLRIEEQRVAVDRAVAAKSMVQDELCRAQNRMEEMRCLPNP